MCENYNVIIAKVADKFSEIIFLSLTRFMKGISKNKFILPLFLLSVFLYPFLQKEIHAIEHAGDFRCTTLTQTHLHQEQHHCSVCDFAVTSAVVLPLSDNLPANVGISHSFNLSGNHFFTSPHYLFLLRAPPALL